jgi:hypothetical protein
MALKINCPECNRRISVDEAFAGGVCRCPYCKAIVFVPGRVGQESGSQRPDAPVGLSDPLQARRISAEEAAAVASRQQHIPTAHRAKTWYVVVMSLVLAVVAAVALGLAIAML